jgi:hypothetical protein
VRDEFPDHLGDEQEMIVIHPYCITALVLTHDDFGKGSVDGDIVLPTILLPDLGVWIIGNLIMKRWPNDLLAISIIMALEVGVGNEDWNGLVVNIKVIRDIRLLPL